MSSRGGQENTKSSGTSIPAEGEAGLPPDLRARLNGQLAGQTIVAWSEFDVDENNQYAQQFVVLTEMALFITSGTPPVVDRPIAISSIAEAKIVEGLGVDRLTIISDGRLIAELRYSRAHRRGMTKLHRKLERRLPSKLAADDLPPEWLESLEREAEKNEHCPKCGKLIPTYAEGVCPTCQQGRAILWRLLDVAKPYRPRIWFALTLTMLVSALAIIPPLVTGQIVNDLTEQRGGYSRLFMWSAIMVGVILVSETLGSWRLLILSRIGTSVTSDLRHMVYAHLHSLSLRYFAKRRTGSLITRVTSDTERLWDFIVFGSVNLIRDVAMIFFIAGAMFWSNWRLAAVTLLPVPILAVITYYRGRKMQRIWARVWNYYSRMSGVVGDAIPGVKVVKAFANEPGEISRFDKRSMEYTHQEQEVHRVWTSLQGLVSGLMRVGAIIVWLVGGFLIIRSGYDGDFKIGTLVTFSMFVWQFYQPVMELANSNRMVTRAATSAQRVFEVLDTAPEIYSKTNSLVPDKFDGRVEFKQISFSYEGASPALREVSLVVEPGEMIGLCGPSGAGKSTFVNLVSRFYDPTDGQILIDGRDIREYDVRWLRRQIGMVLQEPYLFHGTISENICYGNPDASAARIVAAAKAANAHDFIVGFPDGYDTMVGERGQSLSGGERQRISIARAILHNPRILILDEATSSVDTETEKQIQQALDRLVEGRTTIAIAHRLSTLQAASRLVVLEKGRVKEEGTHDELVDKPDGVYAKLYRTQVEMNAQVVIR